MQKKPQELKGMQEALAALEAALDASGMAICLSDLETGLVLLANKSFCLLAGIAQEDAEGQDCYELASGCFDEKKSGLFSPLRHTVIDEDNNPREPAVWETYAYRTGRHVRVTSQAVPWLEGRYVYVNFLVDISAEHTMQEELEHLAFYDNELGLPNVKKLESDLAGVPQKHRSSVYLVGLDIVSLRKINQGYGRLAGTALLEAVTSWLKKGHFANSSLYQFENEFVIRLDDCTKEGAMFVANTVAERFKYEWDIEVEGETLEIFCGIWRYIISGADLYDENGDVLALRDVMQRANDIAHRKRSLVMYNAREDEEQQKYNRFELHLSHCVNNGMEGFSLAFQPIVDPTTGEWKMLETLCRWNSPVHGDVSPGVFIPKAEKMGLIAPLGRWILQRAVELSSTWGFFDRPDSMLSVNVSPVQFQENDFAPFVLNCLEENNFAPERLCIELTESTEFQWDENSKAELGALCEAGVRFALDDFGTGYSSFKNLKDLPVGILKTEHEFIRNIETNSYMQAMFSTMVNLAHTAGMRLVAEGIETKKQLDIVQGHGADFIQGYYYSRPITQASIPAALRAHRNAATK